MKHRLLWRRSRYTATPPPAIQSNAQAVHGTRLSARSWIQAPALQCHHFDVLLEMKKSLSGTDIPNEVALAVGRFIMYFGYLEFQLWLWFNEVADDEERAKDFVTKTLERKVGSVKSALEGLNLKKEDRKRLLGFLESLQALAESRNLVCHNPYMTIAGGYRERDKGAIFGIRSATLQRDPDIREANLSDLRRFESDAARMSAECHHLFLVLQSGLPPKQ